MYVCVYIHTYVCLFIKSSQDVLTMICCTTRPFPIVPTLVLCLPGSFNLANILVLVNTHKDYAATPKHTNTNFGFITQPVAF